MGTSDGAKVAGQQQPGFAGQQQPGFAGQQQPGFTGQQQPGFNSQQQQGSLANSSQGSLVNSSQGSESSAHRSGMGALQNKTSQVGVHATLWHATSSSRRLPIAVLVDTEAGGGNYVLRQFIEPIEERDGWGKSLINPTGDGLLSAANPKNSAVPPMEVVGSCLLPLVFAPVDQLFRAKFRVVKRLPYAMVLRAAFMTDNRSIISFDGEEGFRPTLSSS